MSVTTNTLTNLEEIKLKNIVGIPKGKIIVRYKGKIWDAEVLEDLHSDLLEQMEEK